MKLSELWEERRALENMHPTASVNRRLAMVKQWIQQIHDQRFGIEWADTITEPGPEPLTIDVTPRPPYAIAAPDQPFQIPKLRKV